MIQFYILTLKVAPFIEIRRRFYATLANFNRLVCVNMLTIYLVLDFNLIIRLLSRGFSCSNAKSSKILFFYCYLSKMVITNTPNIGQTSCCRIKNPDEMKLKSLLVTHLKIRLKNRWNRVLAEFLFMFFIISIESERIKQFPHMFRLILQFIDDSESLTVMSHQSVKSASVLLIVIDSNLSQTFLPLISSCVRAQFSVIFLIRLISSPHLSLSLSPSRIFSLFISSLSLCSLIFNPNWTQMVVIAHSVVRLRWQAINTMQFIY